jgi:hypothetical protein
MAQEKTVTFTYVGGVVIADPPSVQLGTGDWILFQAGDDNLYTVIVDSADIYFKTSRKVLMYDVSKYMVNPAITPPEKAPTTGNGLKYNAIVTTSTSADRTDPDPDAPPRIIINH